MLENQNFSFGYGALIRADLEKEYEIKEFKQKRSLDSNSYMWILADKLAEKLHSTKEEIYRIAVANVGVFTEIKIIQLVNINRSNNKQKANPLV